MVADMAEHADTLWGTRFIKPVVHAVQNANRRSCSPSRCGKQRKWANTPGIGGMSFYHAKFGKDAHRCEAPCRHQPSGNALAADDSN